MVAGMLMPLRDLRAIYEVLFRDGVMVAKKDRRPQIKHPDVHDVSNLQVIRAMGSLKSRGYVKETFTWRHFYWYLTNEGIVYLRDYLHLPPEIVPASLQRVRKPAASQAITQRATRVQSVEGPTSYVPKPGRRGEAESQEAVAERQGYRHRMMGPGERENYFDRTPRFRGRPLAAEPVRPKASWEGEDHSQPLFSKESSIRSEAEVMEESRMKRLSRQQPAVGRERPVMTSQERRVFEVQKEKVLVPVQMAALKQDVQQTTQTTVSSKTALPLTVAAVTEATAAATSKILGEPKTNKEKPKITDEKTFTKSSEMFTSKSVITRFPDTEIREDKRKKVTVDPVKSAEVKARAETVIDKVQSQALITMAAPREPTSLITDTATATSVITKSINRDVTGQKTKKVIVDPVKSAEVTTIVGTVTDEGKPQTVTAIASAQESSKCLTPTDAAASVITKPVNKDVKEEKLTKTKVTEASLKPTVEKTPVPVEPKTDHERAKKPAKVTISQQTTTPKPDSSKSKPEGSTNIAQELSTVKVSQEPIGMTMTSVNLSEKPKTDGVLQKTITVTESSILESKTTISTTSLMAPVANAEVAQPVTGETTITEMIRKQGKRDVKITAHVKKDEKVAPEEELKDSIQGPTLVQKDTSSPQHSHNVVTTEVIKETKQVLEGSSKSKRKKKKGEISKTVTAEEPAATKVEEIKTSEDKLHEEVVKNTLQPLPVMTSEPSIKTEGGTPVEKKRSPTDIDKDQIKEVPKHADGKPKEEVSEQAKTISEEELGQILAVSPVEHTDDAQLRATVEESNVSKITHGPLLSKGELSAMLPHMKSEETAIIKVETGKVKKVIQVEAIQESSKCEEESPAPLSESQKPTIVTKSLSSTGKATEESSKGKKKGKEKKQAKASESETVTTKPVILPEVLPSTMITSFPKATGKGSPVMASELTETSVSPKIVPKRMCSEETRQSAAVLSEAPADKGEAEPVLLNTEKIKREVPKPKTSSTAREAPAAGELASAATVTAEAGAAPAHEHEEEKKRDLKEDTPSVTATPGASQPAQPDLGDTCNSKSPDTDEATMKRKIVVVEEEIVEVKQLVNPQAAGEQTSPPPPVQCEAEEVERDMGIKGQIISEMALLNRDEGAKMKEASADTEWDHSLEEPQEKKWPNFIEGLFECMPVDLLPALSCSLCM
uniref:uncharacterized protein LOC109958499 n=1 Tax=Monopterus albus TaxID=43700 RepID=UPI0009B47565|nr:uncharacterized protein LOC109958499 [Monopterus albus]